MADEEKNEETENEQPEAEAPAEEAPAAEPAAEEEQPAADPAAPGSEAEEAAGSDVAEGDDSGEGAKAPAAGSGVKPEASEPEETPHPKALRKSRRSEHSGEAKPARTNEERAAERVERRRQNAKSRSRYRATQRKKRGEPGTGTPPVERELADRKVRQGIVVSSKGDKSITVKVEQVGRHTRYEKVVRHSRTMHAHDESNQANEGDVVRIIETRPISRTKRWKLIDVIERAR